MTYNELVEKARELGVAIQDTDEFTAFIVAKTAADKSEKLQDKLGQFNLKKLDSNTQLSRFLYQFSVSHVFYPP